jgi:hypothetical protein
MFMKKAAIGFLWFLGLYFGTSFLLGTVVSYQGTLEGKTSDEIYQTAYEAGESLGVPIFLISAGAAIAGTATKKLPGTG